MGLLLNQEIIFKEATENKTASGREKSPSYATVGEVFKCQHTPEKAETAFLAVGIVLRQPQRVMLSVADAKKIHSKDKYEFEGEDYIVRTEPEIFNALPQTAHGQFFSEREQYQQDS